jgi:hypothetical protein
LERYQPPSLEYGFTGFSGFGGNFFTFISIMVSLRCFRGRSGGVDAKRNDEIEKKIRQDKKKQEREVKILLLGM